MSADTATKIVVQAILEDTNREWSLQGLGMLRTYLPNNARLHIWNPDLKFADVSELHTHPWDMKSYVVNGQVRNHIYERFDLRHQGIIYNEQRIKCGPGGNIEGDPQECVLVPRPPQTIEWGGTYRQSHKTIHRSEPLPGTVTIISRTIPEGGHPDYAYVYFPSGEEWVSAEPRTATPSEIQSSVELALSMWS